MRRIKWANESGQGKNPVEWTYHVEVGTTRPISTSLKNQGCFLLRASRM